MATAVPPNPLNDQLFQARLKANDFVQEHLKTIVTIASGTLVLTVSFVKDVVAGSPATERLPWLLAVSWAALGLAVFCGTFGLAVLVNKLDDADLGEINRIPVAFSAGKSGVVLRWVWFSIGFFALRIVSLAAFGAANYSLFLRRPEAKKVEARQERSASRFAIASTPEHTVARNVIRSHTFLLDQRTGQVWQMVCSKGPMVTFQKISIEGIPVEDMPATEQPKNGQP
jgi:hypothetical protein